jgi:hypothetical protein
MADDDRVRIEIGFEGGQILRLQVPPADADGLARMLQAGGDGTAELGLEDGVCLVALSRVLYVTRYARESKVGFAR